MSFYKRLLLGFLLCTPALAQSGGGVPATVPQYFINQTEITAGATIAAQGYPVMNAIRYGCDPTGVTSSNNCLTSIANYCNTSVTCTAYFPTGTYKTSGTIFTNAGVLIKGDGPNSTIFLNSATNTPTLTFGTSGTQTYGGGIEGVGFAGASGVTGVNGQTAFSILKVGQFHVDNVNIISTPTALYKGAYFAASSQFTVHNIQAQGMLSDGVTLIGTIDAYITDSRSDANAGGGWVLNNAQGSYFKSVTGYNNTGGAFYLNSTSPSTAPNSNNFFVGCVGDTSGTFNWYIGDSENSYFVNTWASSQQSTTVNTYATGIYITGQYSNGLFFTGGTVDNNNSHGVQINDPGSNAPTNISFVNFQFGSGFHGNGKASGGGYGLMVNGTAPNHIRATGGAFASNVTGTYSLQGSGTDNCVQDNPIGAVNSACAGVTARVISGTVAFVSGTTCTLNVGNGVTGCTYNSTGNYTTTISPAYTTVYGCSAAPAGTIGTPIDVVVNFTSSSVTVAATTLASVASNNTMSFVCQGI